jgi:phosphonate transport system permease protein
LPEILQLLFFVVAFGLGPFSGMCALAFSSIGMLGKLVGDAIEDADDKVLESLKATGASFWQVIRYGLLPQVLPSLAANALFRFDVNVRSSVVLGAIGAGGIGAEIARSMGMLQYNRATMAVLGSLILIYAAETVSGQLRRRLLEDGRS